MSEAAERIDYSVIFLSMSTLSGKESIFLSDDDIQLLENIRAIRELVDDLEESSFEVVSRG